MRSLAPLALTIGALVLLGSLPGGAGAVPLVSASAAAASPLPSGPGRLQTDAVAVPPGTEVRPLPGDEPLPLTFVLASPHAAALGEFLAAVQDPASPLYHHFLTYPEYLTRFAPSPAEVQGVESELRGAGATSFQVSPDRAAVATSLTVSEVRALLGAEPVAIGSPAGSLAYTTVGAVTLPTVLAGSVRAIDGLSAVGIHGLLPNLVVDSRPRSLGMPSTGPLFVHDNRSNTNWFVGSDYTQAYGATSLFPGGQVANATFPSRVAVATLLASGYNTTIGVDLPPWDPTVVDAYFNSTFPASWPKPSLTGVPVTIGSATPPLPGHYGSVNDSSLDEIENSLDLEMAGSLAPGAPIYNFYFPGALLAGNASTASVAYDFAQSLSEALAYNYAPARLGVVSGSFGLPDLNDSFWNSELRVAAATGVTVVIASGDQGNAPDYLTGRTDGPWPTWPGSAAFNSSGATAVGGISVGLGGSPTAYFNGTSVDLSFDATVGPIRSMTAWWDTTSGPGKFGGSEGGISTVFSEPSWQFDSAAEWPIVNATLVQGAGSLGRAEPDLAFPANDTIATVEANATGTIFFLVLGGTSVAAPVFAGLLADEIAVASARSSSGWASFGFLDPFLYRAGSYFWEFPSAPNDPFLDVVAGANYVFSAGPGWDPVTGWGGLYAPAFLGALENASLRNFTYTGPTPGLPPRGSSGLAVPWSTTLLIFGIGLAVALGLAMVIVRPRRAPPSPRVPFGVAGSPGYPYGPPAAGGLSGSATFACPYCGSPRPAEPVRCPHCGAL